MRGMAAPSTAVEQTTIRISVENWRRLTAQKTVPGMTMDNVIEMLLDLRESATEPPK